jgi:hypothetical protein
MHHYPAPDQSFTTRTSTSSNNRCVCNLLLFPNKSKPLREFILFINMSYDAERIQRWRDDVARFAHEQPGVPNENLYDQVLTAVRMLNNIDEQDMYV